MSRVLVWDLPVRLFHALFAAGFLTAFGIAELLGDHSPAFPFHAMIGVTLGLMVALRVVWGFVGTRWARFGTFAWSPAALFGYLKEVLSGREGARWAGHNPGTTWAAAVMFVCVAGLGASGWMMTQGNETAEEVHEILAWTMLATVVVHVVGVVWHSVRHREPLPLAMVDGRKVADPAAAIPSASPAAAVVFLALTGAWGGALLQSYDAATGSFTVPLVGATLTLGEEEGGKGDHHETEGQDDE